jgi:glyoxylase-like metal-dependent hydrolase (beta-lactamase superfamily II)
MARIEAIVESELALFPPLAMFPRATREDIERAGAWMSAREYAPELDKLIVAIRSYVVFSGDAVIVVDSCVGDGRRRARPEFDEQRRGWLDQVSALVDPERVDYVVTTHLHVDHVGGHTRRRGDEWVPMFPRARYLLVEEEWAHWTSDHPHVATELQRTGDYLADCVRPLLDAGAVDFVEPSRRVTDEVRLRPAPGETPGHVIVEVGSGASRAVLSADVMHHPLQARNPGWSTSICVEPERATDTRERLLREWAGDRALVYPTHFTEVPAGRVEPCRGGGYCLVP